MNEAVNENFYLLPMIIETLAGQHAQNYFEPYIHCLLVSRIKFSQMKSREGLDAD